MKILKSIFLVLFLGILQGESYGQEVYIPLENLKVFHYYFSKTGSFITITNVVMVSPNDSIYKINSQENFSLEKTSDTTYSIIVSKCIENSEVQIGIIRNGKEEEKHVFIDPIVWEPEARLGVLSYQDTVTRSDFFKLAKGNIKINRASFSTHKNNLDFYLNPDKIISYQVSLKKDESFLFNEPFSNNDGKYCIEKVKKIIKKSGKNEIFKYVLNSLVVRTKSGQSIRVKPVSVTIIPD